jgi:hypothetical protein
LLEAEALVHLMQLKVETEVKAVEPVEHLLVQLAVQAILNQ